jgi:hypothetical protein
VFLVSYLFIMSFLIAMISSIVAIMKLRTEVNVNNVGKVLVAIGGYD